MQQLMKYTFLFLMASLFIQCKNKPAMQPANNPTVHAFRLKPGQDLRKEIERFAANKNITAGYMVTCVGSLVQANIRFANQPNGFLADGHFEIVSLVGTISTNGCHLHISISDSTGKTMGGHLLEGNIVYTTAEIVIGESKDMIFTREKDGSTPWEELQVRPK
jgi:predicted DNA-binding protein with PD1-like motif